MLDVPLHRCSRQVWAVPELLVRVRVAPRIGHGIDEQLEAQGNGSGCVTAAARLPPAESPPIARRSGSAPSAAACSHAQRVEASALRAPPETGARARAGRPLRAPLVRFDGQCYEPSSRGSEDRRRPSRRHGSTRAAPDRRRRSTGRAGRERPRRRPHESRPTSIAEGWRCARRISRASGLARLR